MTNDMTCPECKKTIPLSEDRELCKECSSNHNKAKEVNDGRT